MEKILNGMSLTTLFESVANILGVTRADVIAFLQSQRYRVRHDGAGSYYDTLQLEVLLDHFNKSPEDIQIEAITVSHIAPIIDEQSFYKHGMLSLKDLFLTDTPFKSFMLEFGITPVVHEDGTMQILINGETRTSFRINLRMNDDRCINGFMFGDNPEEDDNVSEMIKCPEFISDISREILLTPVLIDEWMKRSKPSVISFKVLLSELDDSTFDSDNHIENQCHLLLRGMERLLFAVTHRTSDNPKVYLKEHVNIDANRILEIREINKNQS